MFCRVTTYDSHIRDVAFILYTVGAFAVHTTSGWIQGLQLMGTEGEGISQWFLRNSVFFTVFIQVIWFLVSCYDAYGDWHSNVDKVENLSWLEWMYTLACSTALKSLDLPHHIATSPTAFHYKKSSLPWAQLKCHTSRVWITGYPIDAMKTVENYANGTWGQKVHVALSTFALIVQVLVFFTQTTERSTAECLIWLVCTIGSSWLFYRSVQQLRTDNNDLQIAIAEIDHVIASTEGQRGCKAHCDSAKNVRKLL